MNPLTVLRQATSSKQPRFGGSAEDAKSIFSSTIRWITEHMDDEPSVDPDNRERDIWLRDFWPQEPYMAGVLASMTMIDKNRSWMLTGGRNQVIRYSNILQNAEGGEGWRKYASLQSLSYMTSDLGAVTEIGRDQLPNQDVGALRGLYHVDPTRFVQSQDGGLYYPPNSANKPQAWQETDFFTTTSMPSTDETMNGVGLCALSRAVELAKLMVAIYQYDHEQLGSRAPKGLLILNNISEHQWETAMRSRDRKLDGMEREYFGGVAVLASGAIDQVQAQLVALSNLPAGFDQKTFVDLLMYGYALIFGVDPAEIWVTPGGLGKGTETFIQHQKATGKGAVAFSRDFQDNLGKPNVLPPSVTFEFDNTDTTGQIMEADEAAAWVDLTTRMYETGLDIGAPLLNRDEARSLLASKGVIPTEWTMIEEEEIVTDRSLPYDWQIDDRHVEKMMRHEQHVLRLRYRDNERVMRAARQFQDDPIVQYRFPSNRVVQLWDSGKDAAPPLFVVPELPAGNFSKRYSRQTIIWESTDGEVTITDDDVETAVNQALATGQSELAEALTNEPLTDAEIEELENG